MLSTSSTTTTTMTTTTTAARPPRPRPRPKKLWDSPRVSYSNDFLWLRDARGSLAEATELYCPALRISPEAPRISLESLECLQNLCRSRYLAKFYEILRGDFIADHCLYQGSRSNLCAFPGVREWSASRSFQGIFGHFGTTTAIRPRASGVIKRDPNTT